MFTIAPEPSKDRCDDTRPIFSNSALSTETLLCLIFGVSELDVLVFFAEGGQSALLALQSVVSRCCTLDNPHVVLKQETLLAQLLTSDGLWIVQAICVIATVAFGCA